MSKTVFITGAANGIGRATTELLVEHGHDVIAFDIDEGGLNDLPDVATTYRGDVYDEERVEEVVSEESFDVLINCAGFQERGAIEDMPAEYVEKHFETNVFGLLNVTRAALPMLREKQGRIVNVSSIAGKVAGVYWGAYAGSKHAVEGVSDSLRMEVKEFGVDVIVVEPGMIRTGFNERGRNALKKYVPGSVYAEKYKKILSEPMAGADPEQAAKVLVKAAETKRPNARYTVTWQAWIAPKLKVLLPTWIWDRIVKEA